MFFEGKEAKYNANLEWFKNADDLKEVHDIIYRKYFQPKLQAIVFTRLKLDYL